MLQFNMSDIIKLSNALRKLWKTIFILCKEIIVSLFSNFSKFLEDYISYGVNSGSDPGKIDEINKEVLPLIRLFERK